jgi:hypothetical protein
MKDNFLNQLIISLFHTTLITFFNMHKSIKMTYIVVRREYIATDGALFIEELESYLFLIISISFITI